MCPASRILRCCILVETRCRLPQVSALVTRFLLRSFHFKSRTIQSILVQQPSIFFFKASVMVQVSEPYSRIDSTVAWNRLIFRSRLMSDCQIVLILWQAAQALAFLTKKSCSELAIHDPRYTKSSTSSIPHPLLETSGAGTGLGVLTKRYLVLPSFMCRPTDLAASSRLSRNACASLMVSVIRAGPHHPQTLHQLASLPGVVYSVQA